MGRGMPHERERVGHPPAAVNASMVALFLIPMITMRLFAEEKRSGTIELLMTSPVRDLEIILGKWLGALLLYICMLAHVGRQYRAAVRLRQAGLEADPGRLPGLAAAGRRAAGHRHVHLDHHQQPDHRRRRHLLRVPAALGADWFTAFDTTGYGQVVNYLSVVTHFEAFSKGVIDTKDVIFYLSMIFFGLFLTARSMESLRWRA